MTRFYKQRPDLAFLLMPASGDRSYEEITVGASTTPYESGSVLALDPVIGAYVTVTTELLAEADVKLALLANRTVFHADDELTFAPALAVVRDATIKAFELELPEDVTLVEIAPFLEKQGLILCS